MAQSWPVHSWRNSGVQSVGGGLVLDSTGDRLLFYASAQAGLPYDDHWGGGNSSMGMASLRRDGFTSVEAMMSGSPGVLTTRPLIWDADQDRLFVNVVIQPGGFFQAAVLEVGGADNSSIPGLDLGNSTVGDIPIGRCVPDEASPFDSTRVPIK